MIRSRKPVRYLGVAGVAAWFGVQPATVTQWMARHKGWPVPDALIEPGRHGGPDRAWLPERESEWRAWKASLPGKTGRPRKGLRAEMMSVSKCQ